MLITEIYSNVDIVGSVNEMRRCLDRVVKNKIFQNSDIPRETIKRIFPRLKTIRRHIVEALRRMRYSKIDQECLANKIEQWKSENPCDRIYFQPRGTTVESASGLDKRTVFQKFLILISKFPFARTKSSSDYTIAIQLSILLKF